MMSIKPFLHEHHLLYDKYDKQEACCDKCSQQIDGWAFTCETCKFWLHKSCAVQQLPRQIPYPLHSQHLLTLVYEDLLDPFHFFCDGCFSLTRNCFYQCEDCDFNLDLICASSTTFTNRRPKVIQHFGHEHPLTQFNYRKLGKNHCSCFWCEKLLSGMSYGCFNCSSQKFFLHESCLINMPTIISKHHFHPSHPLHFKFFYCIRCNACSYRIDSYEFVYTCEKCNFVIHVYCAKVKPSLKHELHSHHLTLFPVQPNSDTYFRCEKCKERISHNKDYVSNDFYHCVECNINFHFLCLVPFSIENEYHRHELELIDFFIEDYSDEYYCDICEEERKPKHHVYYCKKCKFVAHIGCALNKSVDDAKFDHGSTSSLVGGKSSIGKLMKQDETDEGNANSPTYFEVESCSRGHPLSFNEVVEKKKHVCKVCWLEISDEAYACKGCYYYIHKTCAKLPCKVQHPLHPQHSLQLINESLDKSKKFTCEECRDVSCGISYMCYWCDFKLDVKCATSWVPKNETQRLKQMERQSKLCLFNQHHKLDFFNFGLCFKIVECCSFCKRELKGSAYGCFNCGYKLHEICLGSPREMQLQFHPLHSLHLLLVDDEETCCVCMKSIYEKDIRYSCEQCDLYLHPYCAISLKRVLKSKSHDHNLYYFGSNVRSDYYREIKVCGKCKESYFWTSFCFCMECDIKLHIDCALPRSVKSKYHIHPFTLTNRFIKDDLEEYYCDICEEERNPEVHAYHCTECQGLFVAHIDCVLNSEEEIAASEELSSNLALDIEHTSGHENSSEVYKTDEDESSRNEHPGLRIKESQATMNMLQ